MNKTFYVETNRISPDYQEKLEKAFGQPLIDAHEEGRYFVYSLANLPETPTFDQAWLIGSSKEQMIEKGLLPLIRVEYDVVLSNSGRHIRSSMDVCTAGDPTVECIYKLMNIYKDLGGISLGETTAWVQHA